MIFKKAENTSINLSNFTQATDTPEAYQEAQRQKKIKENEAYIEYIKQHDEEAYKRYLSYSTYLKY